MQRFESVTILELAAVTRNSLSALQECCSTRCAKDSEMMLRLELVAAAAKVQTILLEVG